MKAREDPVGAFAFILAQEPNNQFRLDVVVPFLLFCLLVCDTEFKHLVCVACHVNAIEEVVRHTLVKIRPP
jgi:hypothetical protein